MHFLRKRFLWLGLSSKCRIILWCPTKYLHAESLLGFNKQSKDKFPWKEQALTRISERGVSSSLFGRWSLLSYKCWSNRIWCKIGWSNQEFELQSSEVQSMKLLEKLYKQPLRLNYRNFKSSSFLSTCPCTSWLHPSSSYLKEAQC